MQSVLDAVSTITFVVPKLAATILTIKLPTSVFTLCLEYPEFGGVLLVIIGDAVGFMVGIAVAINLGATLGVGLDVGLAVGIKVGEGETTVIERSNADNHLKKFSII